MNATSFRIRLASPQVPQGKYDIRMEYYCRYPVRVFSRSGDSLLFDKSASRQVTSGYICSGALLGVQCEDGWSLAAKECSLAFRNASYACFVNSLHPDDDVQDAGGVFPWVSCLTVVLGLALMIWLTLRYAIPGVKGSSLLAVMFFAFSLVFLVILAMVISVKLTGTPPVEIVTTIGQARTGQVTQANLPTRTWQLSDTVSLIACIATICIFVPFFYFLNQCLAAQRESDFDSDEDDEDDESSGASSP